MFSITALARHQMYHLDATHVALLQPMYTRDARTAPSELRGGVWRGRKVLSDLRALDSTEAGVALVEDGIDALEESVTQDIEGHVTPGLDTSIHHTVPSIRKRQIFLHDGKQVIANGELHNGELVGGHARREGVSLLCGIVRGARDGGVDSLAGGVVNKSKGSARISDGGIARASNAGAVDAGGGGVEHPEALGVIDGSVDGLLARSSDGGLVDVTKGVEGDALVWVTGIAPRAEVGGEELLILGNIVLSDHILHRGLGGSGSDSVDGPPGKPEKPITNARGELGGESLGKLDFLVLDGQAANGHVVGTNGA